jgi:hypothetical protein
MEEAITVCAVSPVGAGANGDAVAATTTATAPAAQVNGDRRAPVPPGQGERRDPCNHRINPRNLARNFAAGFAELENLPNTTEFEHVKAQLHAVQEQIEQ